MRQENDQGACSHLKWRGSRLSYPEGKHLGARENQRRKYIEKDSETQVDVPDELENEQQWVSL